MPTKNKRRTGRTRKREPFLQNAGHYDIAVAEYSPHVYSVVIPNRRTRQKVKSLADAYGPRAWAANVFTNAVAAVMTTMHFNLYGKAIDTTAGPIFEPAASPEEDSKVFATLRLSNPEAREMIELTSRQLQVSRALLINRLAQAVLSAHDTLHTAPGKVH